MPTGGKGSGGGKKPIPAQRRALEQLAAKARASRQQAKVTERKAQHVDDAKPKKKVVQPEYVTHPYTKKAAAQLRAAKNEKHPYTKEASFGPSPHLVTQTIKDFGEAAYYTPGGIYALGKGIGKDVAETHVSSGHKPDFSFKRTRAMGKVIGRASCR